MNRAELNGFAVDLGGTKTAAARIEAGEVAERRSRPTDGGSGVTAQLDAMAALLRDLGHDQRAPLGVTVTGRLTADKRWSAVNAGTLTRIDDVPLGALLRDRFGRAGCSNDAAATALAEALFGAGQGCAIFVYLTVSTGVGGGIVIGGLPLESGRGLAGHLGFVRSPHGQNACGSGRNGTVESIAGGRAIAAAAKRAGHPGATARDVFEAAREGAPWAETIAGDSARAIATLCADIAAALDPDRIAIGGGIGLSPGHIDRIRRHLADEPALFRPPLAAAVLKDEGPLLGALAHALREGTG